MSSIANSFASNNVANSTDINLPNIKTSSNRFEIKTSGVSQLFVDSAGKVGIGTSEPNHLLHLFQPDLNDVNIKITNDNSNNGILFGMDAFQNLQIKNRDAYGIEFFTNDTKRLCLGVSGDLGLGTDNPSENFHIHEDSSNQNYIRFSNDDTTDGLNFGLDSNGHGVFRHRDEKQLKFYTDDIQNLTIGSDGRVGIGRVADTGKLEVRTALASESILGRFINQDGGDAVISFSVGSVISDYCKISCINSGGGDRDLSFSSFDASGGGTGERVRITGEGHVGIGMTNPQWKLDVGGNINIGDTNSYKQGGDTIIDSSQNGWFNNITTTGNLTLGGNKIETQNYNKLDIISNTNVDTEGVTLRTDTVTGNEPTSRVQLLKNETITLDTYSGGVVDNNITMSNDKTVSSKGIYGNNTTVKRYNNGTQSITDNSTVTVTFNNQDWNIGGITYSNGTFTFPSGYRGLYQIYYRVIYDKDTSGDRIVFIEHKDSGGSSKGQPGWNTMIGTGHLHTSLSTTCIVNINGVDDTITLRTKQTSNGSLNIGGTNSSFFTEIIIRKLQDSL